MWLLLIIGISAVSLYQGHSVNGPLGVVWVCALAFVLLKWVSNDDGGEGRPIDPNDPNDQALLERYRNSPQGRADYATAMNASNARIAAGTETRYVEGEGFIPWSAEDQAEAEASGRRTPRQKHYTAESSYTHMR